MNTQQINSETPYIKIYNDDDVFTQLTAYLFEKKYLKDTQVVAKIQHPHELRENKRKKQKCFEKTEDKPPGCKYKSDFLEAEFEYKEKIMKIVIDESKLLLTTQDRQPTKQQIMKIYCDDMEAVKTMIQDALTYFHVKDPGLIRIYEKGCWGAYWSMSQAKEARSLESVILNNELKESVVKDIEKFLDNEEWYEEKGIPFRRGYLLYGPPGCGKTSITEAIAGKLNLNICYLNLSGNKLDDDSINKLLNNTPERSIILLEDIDAIFQQRQNLAMNAGQERYVSFSGLLNAIDGVRSQQGRILFMTTNHKENLDPALLRPGRCDKHVFVDYASKNQAERLFLRFFPEEKEKAKQFAKILPEKKVSMARLQGYFIEHIEDIDATLVSVDKLMQTEQNVIEEMKIQLWLQRLSLEKFLPEFEKRDVSFVTDVHQFNTSQLMEFNIEPMSMKNRFLAAMKNEKSFKEYFKDIDSDSARKLIENYTQDKEEIEILVKASCVDNAISGFILQDILQGESKEKMEDYVKEIEKKAKALLKLTKNDNLKLIKTKEEKEEEEKQKEEEKKEEEQKNEEKKKEEEKKNEESKPDLEKVFKELGLEDKIDNIKQKDLFDWDTFVCLTDKQLLTECAIDIIGKRIKLMNKIKKLNNSKEEKQENTQETENNEDHQGGGD